MAPQLTRISLGGSGASVEVLRTIRLSCEPGSQETVEIGELAPGRFRLHQTPLLADISLSPGDVIEVSEQPDGTYRFERLVASGGLRTHSWNISRQVAESPELEEFKRSVLAAGGQVEHVLGGFLLVHVPLGAPFDVERELDAVVARVRSGRASP